ncbi:MAG: glucan biosynthesis protein D [Thiomonas sp.]|uniref:glucan biosynthesis protein D n=1 Tax=Thiomonas sp. TaxID=2047785 RepID=UPI002A36CAE6|nr:glucan biosynthesis protein D [Thiomonas sp.]MDY0330256.1 glucan biosynthesis protein D [Thiomonas sp.]
MSDSTPRFTRRQVGGALASLAAGLLQPGVAFAAGGGVDGPHAPASPSLPPGGAHPALGRPGGGRWGPPRRFSWDLLVDRARRMATQPYVAPRPSAHAAADWDSFVRMAYGAAEYVTGTVRLFPTRRGVAPLPVSIHVVDHGVARKLIDTRGLFGGGQAVDAAGWRVLAPDARTDWMAFLSASYFRCSGTSNRYGLSARGIAVDTGLGELEEFPAFTDFWIEQPSDDHVIAHALLDGPSLTGAYAIDTRRREGVDVVQDVRCTLFLRRDVQRLGIAPQTSMFLYDQTRADGMPHAHAIGDWRPQVHDSGGLAIRTGIGERIWRPLRNPPAARMNAFRADHPSGFGLMQRNRDFCSYEDDELFYELRPSLWVQPQGDWGTGSVMLYEMASISETVDNIGAFWVADEPARAGQRRDLAYRLTWTSADPSTDTNAHCRNLLIGPSGPVHEPPDPTQRKYVIDFHGDVLAGLDEACGVQAVANLPAAAVIGLRAHPLYGRNNAWRVVLDLRLTGLAQKEFRLFLRRGAQALSETVVIALGD